jgi:hypothetical protein
MGCVTFYLGRTFLCGLFHQHFRLRGFSPPSGEVLLLCGRGEKPVQFRHDLRAVSHTRGNALDRA